MRCLYCGKELALLKRLTGGGEFCSDTHKRSYQEEYNRLAVSRLLQAQTRADLHTKAGKPGPVADEIESGAPKTPQVAASSEPRPGMEAPKVAAVPEPEAQPDYSPIVATYQPDAEPEILPVAEAREPELSASGMSGFLMDLPAIRDFEPNGLNVGEPLEWPQKAHIPAFPTPTASSVPALPEAGLVGYELRLEALRCEQPQIGAAIVVEAFASAGLTMNVTTKSYPLKGFGSAEAISVAI